MKKLMTLALAFAALVSCSKENEEIDQNAPVEIKFGAGITLSSRSIIESDETSGLPTDPITSIQILRGANGATPAFASISSVTCTGDLDKDGTFSNISPAQYFTSTTEAANFIAYYPAATTLSAGKAEYTIDGQTDIIASTPVSLPYSTTDNTVNFTFEHKLARLRLVIKAEAPDAASRYGTLNAAVITVPTKLDMTIGTDGVTTLAKNSTPTDAPLNFVSEEFTFAQDKETTVSDLMILATDAPSTIALTFEKKAKANYSITDLVLTPGEITTLTITIKPTGITFSSKITAWVNGGTNGGATVD